MNSAPNLEKFSCKICLEVAQEPVITPCGHLYCWACIYQWKNTKPEGAFQCPFCSNYIEIEKLTPIYTSDEKTGEGEIPKRPMPERSVPPPQEQRNSNGNSNFNFNFFGLPFLFGGFGFTYGNLHANNQPNGNGNRPQNRIFNGNFSIVLIIIAVNLLLNFGPLIMGISDSDEYEIRHYQTRSRLPPIHRANLKEIPKKPGLFWENEALKFVVGMGFFLGMAFLWKMIMKRNH